MSIGKQKTKIDDMKDYADQLRTHINQLKKGKKGLDEEEVTKKVLKKLKEAEVDEKFKHVARKFPGDQERSTEALKKLDKRINTEEKKMVEREENKAIALGTSKLNYNDPRITVKWCKVNEVPIEKLFSKTVRSKFPWAMYTELDWRF